MADEKSGPYKVVSKLVSASDPHKYSIVLQKAHGAFFIEVIPDAGMAETARDICNLLNKRYKETQGNDDPDRPVVAEQNQGSNQRNDSA